MLEADNLKTYFLIFVYTSANYYKHLHLNLHMVRKGNAFVYIQDNQGFRMYIYRREWVVFNCH